MSFVRLPEDWGIRPVPLDHRRLRPFDLGVLWGDLAISLLVMVAGALLVPGLGTQAALLAIVVGTLLGTVLLALAGIAATDVGVPTMVTLRPPLGIRGSYVASALNILQLVGWAALEVIIMAQAARPLSDRYLGFSGYYVWLVFFGLVGIAMAVGGPILVVREWMQKFGMWIVVAASVWLTFYLFHTYDMGAIWHRRGEGGFPNFWQGVDLVVALPVSWLPLVGDYNRFARRAVPGAIGTYAGYAIANIWFFALGMLYVQALKADATGFIDALVKMILPLTAGWLALIVLLFGESDEGFADIYSTAVSIQNLAPRLRQALLAVVVGVLAIVLAISLDLLQYENFLLLIGGVFVPVFGIFIADYFVARSRRYEIDALYERSGSYWYALGVNPVGLAVWVASFVLYALCAQPPWLLEHADFISWAPEWMLKIGGTLPAFALSFVAYWLGFQLLQKHQRSAHGAPAVISPPGEVALVLPWISLAVSVGVAASALMPWAKLDFIFTQTMAGTHLEQGKAVLVLGFGAAGVALLRAVGLRSILTSGLQFGLASGALGCAAYVLHELMSCGDFQALCSSVIGDGLYFSVVAGGVLVAVSAGEVLLDLIAAVAPAAADGGQ